MAAGIAACLTKDNQSKPTASYLPSADNTLSLGSTTLRWLAAWVGSLKIKTGSFTVTQSATLLTADRAIEWPDAAGTVALAGEAAFAVGTRLIFQQTAAPSGWTKQTSSVYNDAAIRLTTGTVSTGGADAFTTLFGSSKTTASMTLSLTQIAAHTHNSNWKSTIGGDSSGGDPNSIATTTAATTSAGGGGSHNHTLSNMNLKFADAIICAKA